MSKLKIDKQITAEKLLPKIYRLFDLSAAKIISLEKTWDPSGGTPVFTVKGKYTSRGWTEWTQGFQYGSALLQFDATGEKQFLELGRKKTIKSMAAHVSHMGVHDHGFNNISTYGNLWRLMREGKLPFNEQENNFYELALKVSGAVQAARWTNTADGAGFIYSFNGPHSLFVDTMRSLRSLAVAHQLGHVLMGERDQRISLLRRLLHHALTTARFNIYYGEGRDKYDLPGRTAHESIFNVNDGSYRCPNSQQGYSPFSTWTRGLAWAILGYAEQLEFLDIVNSRELLLPLLGQRAGVRASLLSPPRPRSRPPPPQSSLTIQNAFLRAAMMTANFYLANSCADGVPMWDTGAPNLHRLGDCLKRPSDPFNAWEPVDSSAAAIAAQGLLRLGNYLGKARHSVRAATRLAHSELRALSDAPYLDYRQAALTIAGTLLSAPYLSTNQKHQGLLLHSVYHRPNGWDHITPGQKVPNSESSMWGDYHLRELALLILREAQGEKYPTFFG